MSSTEFANNSSNEAIQTNLVIYDIRDELLRMAPWNCSTNVANLVYITSSPGTPENTSPPTQLWQKGQPYPPWTYEYQYPGDCLRPLWIIPAIQQGFAGGIPITPVNTGGAGNFWPFPACKFRVSIDQFFAISAATVVSGGTNYLVGDLIVLPGTTFFNPSDFSSPDFQLSGPPIGAAGILQVTSINPATGAVTGVSLVNSLSQAQPEASEIVTGSYFAIQGSPLSQQSTSGVGTGAAFTITWTTLMDQRVILTNQEFATLCYVKRVTDPNVMDPNLIQAWVAMLAARLMYQLSGDKVGANMKIAEANAFVIEARKADGNEGLTINDVTPDWIRARGINFVDWEYSPNQNFDWGGTFPFY
jgi:hypothetical protein